MCENTTFSKRLKTLRKEKRLNQEEISNQLHIDRTTYSNWENNKSDPKYTELINLSQIFNVDIAYLMCQSDIKSQDVNTISHLTHLSKESIQILIEDKEISCFIDFMISHSIDILEINKRSQQIVAMNYVNKALDTVLSNMIIKKFSHYFELFILEAQTVFNSNAFADFITNIIKPACPKDIDSYIRKNIICDSIYTSFLEKNKSLKNFKNNQKMNLFIQFIAELSFESLNSSLTIDLSKSVIDKKLSYILSDYIQNRINQINISCQADAQSISQNRDKHL